MAERIVAPSHASRCHQLSVFRIYGMSVEKNRPKANPRQLDSIQCISELERLYIVRADQRGRVVPRPHFMVVPSNKHIPG